MEIRLKEDAYEFADEHKLRDQSAGTDRQEGQAKILRAPAEVGFAPQAVNRLHRSEGGYPEEGNHEQAGKQGLRANEAKRLAIAR